MPLTIPKNGHVLWHLKGGGGLAAHKFTFQHNSGGGYVMNYETRNRRRVTTVPIPLSFKEGNRCLRVTADTSDPQWGKKLRHQASWYGLSAITSLANSLGYGKSVYTSRGSHNDMIFGRFSVTGGTKATLRYTDSNGKRVRHVGTPKYIASVLGRVPPGLETRISVVSSRV